MLKSLPRASTMPTYPDNVTPIRDANRSARRISQSMPAFIHDAAPLDDTAPTPRCVPPPAPAFPHHVTLVGVPNRAPRPPAPSNASLISQIGAALDTARRPAAPPSIVPAPSPSELLLRRAQQAPRRTAATRSERSQLAPPPPARRPATTVLVSEASRVELTHAHAQRTPRRAAPPLPSLVPDTRSADELDEPRFVSALPAARHSTPAWDTIAEPAPAAARPRAPIPAAKPRVRSRGESFARFLYFVSGALLAAAVALYGGRLWREIHPLAPPPAPAAPIAAAAVAAPSGRIELAADHRGVSRLERGAPRWTAALPVAVDALELTGPLVLGHAGDVVVALDLESGRTRFTWSLPTGERWGVQRPVALGSCLVTLTTRAAKTSAHCVDLATGAVRWTAALTGEHDCVQPPLGVPGAVVVPCSGWTAVIDDHSGAINVIAGGASLVQDQPAYLLRTGGKPVVMPWSAAKRRFTATGDITYGATAMASSSAVLHKDRLVLRAVDSSDDLAVIAPRDGAPISVTAPVYRLADATPLVRSCGGETSPRFQLLELAPRIGASFDPAIAQDRALALLDVETATLAWTSRKVAGLHPARAAQPPICRGGHYFLPLALTDRTGKPTSALWVVDAETGKTAAAVAFDPELAASAAELTADQIDDDRVVGIGRHGAFELAWRTPGHGLHDARAELEGALGPLP
jgi:hypothetical protein